MKIGAFAKKYCVPIPTIRYYINLGLVLPKKEGTQYSFNKKNEKEMETVLDLREAGFSLKDMEHYINAQRVFDVKDKELYHRLFPLLQSKKSELLAECSHIKEIIGRIDTKIAALRAEENLNHLSPAPEKIPQDVSGLHTDFLQLLACPVCGSPLCLKDALIMENGIISGSLSCGCGYTGSIKDGVFFTDETVDLDEDPVFADDYFADPSEETDYVPPFFELFDGAHSEYLTLQHKAREWMHDCTINNAAGKKVILFPDVASLFLYLYHDASYLQDALILVMGLSKNGVIPIREHLELLDMNLKIAFIVSPECSLPIKNGSIDLMLDYLGSFSYAFYKDQYFYHYVDRYFAKDAVIIGCLDYYEKSSRTIPNIRSLYSNSAHPFLGLTQQKTLFEEYHYRIIENEILGYAADPASYFDYHVQGDRRYVYVYFACRK